MSGPLRFPGVHRIEFTIEPFVEGRPGPHVTEAIEAVRRLGVEIEVGPFGSACTVTEARSAEVVATIVGAAFAHGADHVNVDVTEEGDA